jgi:hypothetical protein
MMRAILLGTVLLCTTPVMSAAQACLAAPTRAGQVALAGSIGMPNGGVVYGIGATLDLRGPFAFAAQLSLAKPDNIEEDITTFSATFAYEVPYFGISACPLFGIEHSTYDVQFSGLEVNWRQVVLPVGLGFGKTFSAAGLDLLVHGSPQYLYTHTYIHFNVRGALSDERESEHEFAVAVGARARRDNAFGGVSVGATSVNDWKYAVYTFTLGLVLGEAR